MINLLMVLFIYWFESVCQMDYTYLHTVFRKVIHNSLGVLRNYTF